MLEFKRVVTREWGINVYTRREYINGPICRRHTHTNTHTKRRHETALRSINQQWFTHHNL